MRYIVRCQSASGQVMDVHVYAGNDSAACRVALSQLPEGAGFMAIYALQED